MTFHRRPVAALLLVLLAGLVLAACRNTAPASTVMPPPTATSPTTEPATPAPPATELPPTDEPATVAPEPESAPTVTPLPPLGLDLELMPGVADYSLGETTIVQERFPEDSRVRNMPIRLEGLIAVPEDSGRPAPLVIILHGNHFGCPTRPEQFDLDVWPCTREEEQLNYRGWDYLVRALADAGYAAIAPNINAEYTLGFGEGDFSERTSQIILLHLAALREATNGGPNEFGVELDNRVDLSQVAFIGHSQGGELANLLTRVKGWDSPYSLVDNGFGPVDGILLVAPALGFAVSTGGILPTGVILPACDGDVIGLDGQSYMEALRADPEFGAWAQSVLLENANHNAFNRILRPDRSLGPRCAGLMAPEAQRDFLVAYAQDFLAALWSAPPERVEAMARLGLDAAAPVAAEAYGRPARFVAILPERLPVLTALTEDEIDAAQADGRLAPEGVELVFCPAGYFVPMENPVAETCRRPNATTPGNPAMIAVTWEGSGAALRLSLPGGPQDISSYRSLRIRAAVDPISDLNSPGEPQSFSVVLTDRSGRSASAVVEPAEPALQFPAGETVPDDLFEQGLFDGILFLADIRLPVTAFEGIDLTAITGLDIVFDQTDSGYVMLNDIEFIRPEAVIGANSTLLENATGQSDALRAIGRLEGKANCTATFVDVGGGADAPAYVISNGHCAQEWDGNAVFTDLPGDGWTVRFNYFVDTQDAQIEVPVVRAVYSTMKSRDLSIIELDATVGDLMAQNLTPIPIAAAAPELPVALRVVGIPQSGVPEGISFLREELCSATATADLFEFIWHFDDTWRNGCRDIYGGSSGSPVFVEGGADVIGLINTTNVGGLTPCAAGVPCEATPNGTQLAPDRSYAIPVAGLAACFAEGRFDLALPDCPLDDGRQLLVSGVQSQATQPEVANSDGQLMPVTWGAILSGELPYYRYKTGPAGVVNCRVEDGYGEVIALSDRQLIDDPLPADEGSYVLCVLAGESPTVDTTWQPVTRATVARREIDTTPPTVEPFVNIIRFEEGVRFEPIFAVAELVDFRVKFGPAETIDCAEETDYLPYRRFPLQIPAEQFPARLCVVGADYAGNETPPYERIVDTLPAP